MTVSNTQLATALVAGESPKTLAQMQLASARSDFNKAKGRLLKQYSGGLEQAQAPLRKALEVRALERLSLKAALEVDKNVGGGVDLQTEAVAIQTAITDAIKAQVEVRSGQIKAQREQQHAATIDQSITLAENKVTALLQGSQTDVKRVKAEFLRQFIVLVIKTNIDELLPDSVRTALSTQNQEDAVYVLADKVLAKFKRVAVAEESTAPAN